MFLLLIRCCRLKGTNKKMRTIENIFKDVFNDKKKLENLILKRSFYERDTSIVARELLGKILVTQSDNKRSKNNFCAGMIVEDEAYYGLNDPASHACNGVTPRSRIMFETPGVAYVYFCYGNHYLLNTITEKFGIPGGVLIRAVQPLYGINLMNERRATDLPENLTNGPGKLTKAFGIGKNFNGRDLTDINSGIFIVDSKGLISGSKINKDNIVSSSRIGIKNGTDRLLRFYIKDSKFISRK